MKSLFNRMLQGPITDQSQHIGADGFFDCSVFAQRARLARLKQMIERWKDMNLMVFMARDL